MKSIFVSLHEKLNAICLLIEKIKVTKEYFTRDRDKDMGILVYFLHTKDINASIFNNFQK